MLVRLEQIVNGDEEVVIRYREMSGEIQRIVEFVEKSQGSLIGKSKDEKVQVRVNDILYVESVEDKTFAYLKEEVVRLDLSLRSLEEILDGERFFRCSKSVIINIDKVERLRSLPSNRIEATMDGGDRIMISRTYASDFRKKLAGGR